MADYPKSAAMFNDDLRGLLQDLIDRANGQNATYLLGNPTLAIGTSSKAKVKNSAFDVIVNGVISTIAGGETAFTATTDDLADGDGAVYLVYLDGSTIKILKGTATTGGTGAVCPATPAGKVKLGEVKLVTSGAVFDATTTELDAATVTDTYTNKIEILPDIADVA